MLCNPTILTEANCWADFDSPSLGGDRSGLFLTSKSQIYSIESIFSGHFTFTLRLDGVVAIYLFPSTKGSLHTALFISKTFLTAPPLPNPTSMRLKQTFPLNLLDIL